METAKNRSRFSRHLCLAVSLVAIAPSTPQRLLELAKRETDFSARVNLLRSCIGADAIEPDAAIARDHLIALLAGYNRYEAALQEYRRKLTLSKPSPSPDFELLELLLKTGRYAEVLRLTSVAWTDSLHDFLHDERVMEYRVQALLAQGQYRLARHVADHWLDAYARDGVEGGLFEGDARSIQFLRRHLMALERIQGPWGKPLFTAAVPDSMQRWSRRRNVPIVFFKLIPAHPPGQLHEPLLPGRHEGNEFFQDVTGELNRGFHYLSRGAFSLSFAGLRTLYIEEGDLDPSGAAANLVASRVYVHTIPPLYRMAGQAFVVLIDYRWQSEGEAAYMGDGLIHVSAEKLGTLTLMHEILHGLGATHQDWAYLESQGYQFDREDRGLMTFDKGELEDLGLEEKNRALLGWPRAAAVHLAVETAALPTEKTHTEKTHSYNLLGNFTD